MSLQERFEAKFERRGVDECWPWLASIGGHGYGQIAIGNHTPALAHRVGHELYIGPIPEGYQVDHVAARGCTLKHCVNPAHLEAVTQQENIRRQKAAGRLVWQVGQAASAAKRRASLTCARGHLWAEHGRHSAGRRYCSACRRERAAAA